MKNLRNLVLFFILINSWIAYGQHGIQDSTRLYSIPAWQMYRFVHDVKKLHSCEEVRFAQNQKIVGLENLVKIQEGIQINLTEQVNSQKLISGTLIIQLEESIDFYKDESKHYKTKFIKTAVIAILEGALIVLILISTL